jgi:catechol 2,3-dioxygenase-like lactoylglutathione lyase family enzyme
VASAKARAIGFNHIALEVGDLDEALEFYGGLFDLDLRGRAHGMAFIDMGDQFLALSQGRSQPPDTERHFGLVVDDREAFRRALEEAGAEIVPSRGLDFRDPWGNHIQVVEYGDVQFSKTPEVLRGMGLGSLGKSPDALAELREKGLAD